MTAAIEARVARKHFGNADVLNNVSIAVATGEVVSLVGASGCGKSTLLRIIAGLDVDFRGSVHVDGRPLNGLNQSIGFVFQEPRLFPWLSVADNVAFGTGRPGKGDPRVTALLDEVGLAGLQDRLPKQISGGQAQRVAIARGLYAQPRALLLDEPFSAVDAFTRIKLQELLARLAKAHAITLLLVTHDVDEAVLLSDRVLVLAQQPGRVHAEVRVDAPRPRDREAAELGVPRRQVLAALRAAHAF